MARGVRAPAVRGVGTPLARGVRPTAAASALASAFDATRGSFCGVVMPRGGARGLAWYAPWPPMSMLFSEALLAAVVSSTAAAPPCTLPAAAPAPAAEDGGEKGPVSGSCSCSFNERYLQRAWGQAAAWVVS